MLLLMKERVCGYDEDDEGKEEDCSQGWERIWSMLSLVSGSLSKQPATSCLAPGLMQSAGSYQASSPARICSSVSKGMSPASMSYRRTPSDQAVRPSPGMWRQCQ